MRPGVARRRFAIPALAALLCLIGGPLRAQEGGAASGEVADSTITVALPVDTLPGIADLAHAMLDSLQLRSDSIAALATLRRLDPDSDLALLRGQALEQVRGMQRHLRSLAHLLGTADRDSLPADSLDAFLRAYIQEHLGRIEASHAGGVTDFEELRRRRTSTSPIEIGLLEADIRAVRAWGDTLWHYEEWALSAADSLGLDVADQWARYDRDLSARVETQVGRLQIAVADRDRLAARLRTAERADAPASEITNLRLQLTAVVERIGGITASLAANSDRLGRRGFETAAYRELLIRTTGQVTGDVLDPQVLRRLVRQLAADGWRWVRTNAATLFVRLLMVIGFVALFRFLFALAWRGARALNLVGGSRLFADMVGRTLRPIATLIGLIVGLSVIGVQTTTLVAGLGVAGLVVGFALQDSLSNLFAGLAILASRPYDIDDIVEAAGVIGSVRAMGLWNTTIVTFDARRLLVPNRSIWGSTIENRSAESKRRVETVARIGYDEDLERAIGVLRSLLEEDDRVLDDPPPSVYVSRLADSWIELKLWPWVHTADWWALTADLPRIVRLGLAREGIAIPYPRREIVSGPDTGNGGGPPADGMPSPSD
jgi:small-conductance mechanosensitive channel